MSSLMLRPMTLPSSLSLRIWIAISLCINTNWNEIIAFSSDDDRCTAVLRLDFSCLDRCLADAIILIWLKSCVMNRTNKLECIAWVFCWTLLDHLLCSIDNTKQSTKNIFCDRLKICSSDRILCLPKIDDVSSEEHENEQEKKRAKINQWKDVQMKIKWTISKLNWFDLWPKL